MRRFSGSERVTQYDQELLAQYQLEFFRDTGRAEPKAKAKATQRKKRAKCPWSVAGQRHAALAHIQALDKILTQTIGDGLKAFQCGEDETDDVVVKNMLETKKLKPTLILHADEGSPAYSMNWYLFYGRDLRFIPVRDLFHRQWNDFKMALTGAKEWSIVL